MTGPAPGAGGAADRWLPTAEGIAAGIAADAVWSDGMCAFHGATSPESRRHPPRYRSMGADLYEGSAGVARFLGRTAALTGSGPLRDVALGAMRHALATAEGWSLFTGTAGVGLVGLELAAELDAPGLAEPSARLLDRAGQAALDSDGPHDLLVGRAGVLIALEAAVPVRPDRGWGRTAIELGRRLLAAAVVDGPPGPDGPPLSWPLAITGPSTDGVPDADLAGLRLCGLAHGASGVALALDAVARLDPGSTGWHAAARRARAWERSWFSPEHGSWADLRPAADGTGAPDAPPAHPHLWCHGSVGVVAERLGAPGQDTLAVADAVGGLAGISAYAAQLLAGPTGPGAGDEVNSSVCHGLAGLVDVFLDASAVTGRSHWRELAGRLGDLMISDSRRGSWRSGVPGGWPAPGLMLGAAGAGWALLRLHRPDLVPSAWRPARLGDRPRSDIDGQAQLRLIE